jgi:hypothetical protein
MRVFHRLVFGQTFFDQLWSLVGVLIHRRVKDVFFELGVGFQFGKDLVSQGPFRVGIAGCLILRE